MLGPWRTGGATSRHDEQDSMRSFKTRGSRLSSRPFYTTILLLSSFAAYSFLARTQFAGRAAFIDNGSNGQLLGKRSDEPECREIHRADDQCAFAKQYCADDNAGLLPYLNFYYCTLGDVQPVAFAALVLWLGLLFTTIGIAASDFFSVNLSTIATILGLSESLAGVTFLAFGNGSPDVFSTFAAMGSNSASMAVGELIGAASFITGVVAGSMALVREFRVDRKTYARDICFFIVAVCFTMVFLADGHLRFWECWAMIGYYVVYVITVVIWHWYTTRRRSRLRREGEARSHFYGAVGHASDELAGEPYRDDPDDVDTARENGAQTPGTETDLSILEQGPRIEIEGEETVINDDESGSSEDHDRLVAAEVAASMRVLRPRGRRSNTITPIRPSLVGALEFRSALAQLQRESNLQMSPIQGHRRPEHTTHGRSYSADHIAKASERAVQQQADRESNGRRHASHSEGLVVGRERALSSGDDRVPDTIYRDFASVGQTGADESLPLPSQSAQDERTGSPVPSHTTVGGHLAPPSIDLLGPDDESQPHETGHNRSQPQLLLDIPSRRSSYSDRSSPNTSFPNYTDSPMVLTPNPQAERSEFMLPAPAVVRETSFASIPNSIPASPGRPLRWWPYAALPPPHILLGTLFPTLQGWTEKSIWDKLISFISVPSILLLVITLPVVESETSEDSSSLDRTMGYASQTSIGPIAPPISVEPQAIEREGEAQGEGEWERFRRHTLSRSSSYRSMRAASDRTPALDHEETAVEPRYQHPSASMRFPAKPASDIPSESHGEDETPGWNRWLLCLQLFTGPLFAVFVLWANMREEWENPGKILVRMVLYTMLGSLILLGLLLMFTSEHKRPKWHYLFCFLGFIISIAWISTVAGEVVGVLKTVGVVLGISEALLGLTIFAAGNSVGDLVADITVARLGYPVMALSACFGGPMLNILLGIGIGGVIMMVQKANHQHGKAPGSPTYGPYPVQVGGTLMISAITLLIILVGMLILVPMNKWVLNRRIGWGLIAMWTVSTIVNVIVEVSGAWAEV